MIMAIDPGKSGAVVIVDNGDFVNQIRLDKSERDIADFFGSYMNVETCIIENVHAMPGQGVTSMFNFGMSFGFVRGLAVSWVQDYTLVTPQKWQAFFGLVRKKGQPKISNTEKKNKHKDVAASLYPNVKITHGNADALLIAEWGRVHA